MRRTCRSHGEMLRHKIDEARLAFWSGRTVLFETWAPLYSDDYVATYERLAGGYSDYKQRMGQRVWIRNNRNLDRFVHTVIMLPHSALCCLFPDRSRQACWQTTRALHTWALHSK